MTSPKDNPNDTFWLARYAHNKLAPLFAQAKAIEPSLQCAIELSFADETSVYYKNNSISVTAHWSREGMFQQSTLLRDKAAVDVFVAKVEADVANLTPLELGVQA